MPRTQRSQCAGAKYGGSKVGIPGVVRSNLALNHGRRERKFWMQRRSAKNRHSNARTPAETKIRELSGRKSRRNALFGVVQETCGLRRLDGGGSRAHTEDPPPSHRTRL